MFFLRQPNRPKPRKTLPNSMDEGGNGVAAGTGYTVPSSSSNKLSRTSDPVKPSATNVAFRSKVAPLRGEGSNAQPTKLMLTPAKAVVFAAMVPIEPPRLVTTGVQAAPPTCVSVKLLIAALFASMDVGFVMPILHVTTLRLSVSDSKYPVNVAALARGLREIAAAMESTLTAV